MMSNLKEAFDNFMANEVEVREAIDRSTRASWSGRGNGFSVELLPNGKYRVLWNNQIGNQYNSPGIILGIPTLSDEEWNDDEPSLRCYDYAIEELKEKFEERQNSV